MKKSKNLSVKSALPNRGINYSLFHQSRNGMYFCLYEDMWSAYDDFILSQSVDIDCLPLQDRLFVESLIDAL